MVTELFALMAIFATAMHGPDIEVGWVDWFYSDYDLDGDVDLRDWAYFQNDTDRYGDTP